MKNLKSPIRVLILLASSAGLAASSSAAVVLNLTTLIHGSEPVGIPPYLSAKFESTGIDTVKLTMTNHMPVDEFVDNWLFNIDSNSALAFTYVSGVVAIGTTYGSNFTNGGSNMKAGLFDIEFHFPNAGSDPFRFHGGEVSIYTITGLGVDELDFASKSVDDPGSPPSLGGWMSAGHIQGIPGDLSGSIGAAEAVPEPTSLALLGGGLLALAGRRRKQTGA